MMDPSSGRHLHITDKGGELLASEKGGNVNDKKWCIFCTRLRYRETLPIFPQSDSGGKKECHMHAGERLGG
jgi:hypothetical protein